jgi:probable F420-dependent oxidoreductase
MSSKKPFRFSLQSFNTDSPDNWRTLISKTEDLGYSTFFLADHFLSAGPALEPTFHPPQLLAAVPAIAMALEQTDNLRVGCRVFCKSEYEAAGIPFDDFPDRFARLTESVQAYKAFMSGQPLELDGETIRWSGFSGTPMPAQQPHPPLMIGGGSRRILEFAGAEADIVSLNFNNRAGMLGPDGMNSGLAAATANKIDWIRRGAGDRFDSLELEIGAYNTIITDHQEPTAAAIGEALGMSTGDILDHPHCLIGSVDYICEELQRRRELYGISYVAVLDDGENNMVEAFAPVVQRLAGK